MFNIQLLSVIYGSLNNSLFTASHRVPNLARTKRLDTLEVFILFGRNQLVFKIPAYIWPWASIFKKKAGL